MKPIIKKITINLLVFGMVNAFLVSGLFGKIGGYNAFAEDLNPKFYLSEEIEMEKEVQKDWFSRNKWWCSLGALVVGAVALGMGGGGGGDEPTNMEIFWE